MIDWPLFPPQPQSPVDLTDDERAEYEEWLDRMRQMAHENTD